MKIVLDEEKQDVIEDGYVRVTKILEPLSGLIGIDEDVLLEACKRGTEVHRAIQNDAKHLCYALAPAYRGYFRSYLKWKKVTQYKIILSEQRLYDHDLKITGCLDAIVKGTNEMYLVDWKNTASQNRPYWEHQGMFYYHLAKLNGLEINKRIMYVQLCPEGSAPNVHSFEASEVLWRECLKYYYIAMGVQK